MTSRSTIFRWAGAYTLLVTGAIIIFNAIAPANLFSWNFNNARTFITTTLLVFALMALYAQQAERTGVLGLVGFVLAEISLILNIGFRFIDLLVGSQILGQYPEAVNAILQGPYGLVTMLTFAVFAIGYVLFGAASLKARQFPRWASWMLIVGAVLSYATVFVMLPLNVGAILSNAGLAWMGWSMWSPQVASSAQPQPVA